MKKHWGIILSLLLITTSFSACKNSEPTPTTGFVDPIATIMESPGDYPQLSKEEFIEITKDCLSTGEWVLPFGKACFYTYGVNYHAFIVADEYLFSIYSGPGTPSPDGEGFRLDHYINGEILETESDPLLFEDFLQ